jgi:hypothetical protein
MLWVFFVECEDCSFGSEKSQYKDMNRFIFVHQSVEFDIYCVVVFVHIL